MGSEGGAARMCFLKTFSFVAQLSLPETDVAGKLSILMGHGFILNRLDFNFVIVWCWPVGGLWCGVRGGWLEI